MISPTSEVRRFTLLEHEQGATSGWRLAVGWFERASGLRWAWFVREGEGNHG